MGCGPVKNGKQLPITPYKGSWAHQMKTSNTLRKDTQMPELTLAEAIQQGFDCLKGIRYGELNAEQKRILYIYSLWKDGDPEEVAVDTANNTTPSLIDEALRLPFGFGAAPGFEDGTEIN